MEIESTPAIEISRNAIETTSGMTEEAINIIEGSIQADQALHGDIPEVNPNRPTNSNSAEVLDMGVVQTEYGYAKGWEPAGARQTTLGGEVRYGAFRNFEFRWGSNPLVENLASGVRAIGIGDQYFSGQFQFHKQSEASPAFAISYAVTVPTGNESLGLGAGRVNQSWTFLASKDFHGVTFDFNAQYQFIGREDNAGHDQNADFYWGFQRVLRGPLSVIGEFGEATRLNLQTPTNSTTLAGFAYKLNKRTVIDAAIDVGITRGAPQKRIMFGITYEIGKFY